MCCDFERKVKRIKNILKRGEKQPMWKTKSHRLLSASRKPWKFIFIFYLKIVHLWAFFFFLFVLFLVLAPHFLNRTQKPWRDEVRVFDNFCFGWLHPFIYLFFIFFIFLTTVSSSLKVIFTKCRIRKQLELFPRLPAHQQFFFFFLTSSNLSQVRIPLPPSVCGDSSSSARSVHLSGRLSRRGGGGLGLSHIDHITSISRTQPSLLPSRFNLWQQRPDRPSVSVKHTSVLTSSSPAATVLLSLSPCPSINLCLPRPQRVTLCVLQEDATIGPSPSQRLATLRCSITTATGNRPL